MLEHQAERPTEYPYYEEAVTESTWHYHAIQYLEATLTLRYADQERVFVGANNFVYQEEGNTQDKQSPDVYVCYGARNQERKSYLPWEENGIYPQVIFEISSKTSRYIDVGFKRELYDELGVEEYYVFDPLREYIPQGLRAFRRRAEGLEEIPLPSAPESRVRVYSPRLDLDLGVEGPLLRLFEPSTQSALPTSAEAFQQARDAQEQAREAQDQAREAQEQAQQERSRADAAEREVAELQQELERLRQQRPE